MDPITTTVLVIIATTLRVITITTHLLVIVAPAAGDLLKLCRSTTLVVLAVINEFCPIGTSRFSKATLE